MAVFDRSCTRVTNDACKCLNVRISLNKKHFMTVNILDIHNSYSWINYGSNVFSCRGNVVIETKFYDDDLHVSTSRVRLFYVWDMEPLFYNFFFFFYCQSRGWTHYYKFQCTEETLYILSISSEALWQQH